LPSLFDPHATSPRRVHRDRYEAIPNRAPLTAAEKPLCRSSGADIHMPT
jgi:hypothetical protein